MIVLFIALGVVLLAIVVLLQQRVRTPKVKTKTKAKTTDAADDDGTWMGIDCGWVTVLDQVFHQRR